ncbi:MAG: LuxR C-terminal-related transcriptional regulator [Actinomycetota bacterium]|nr:LuxR C-terminal-related transcriptional regulator [Actinomycetota bacterium]
MVSRARLVDRPQGAASPRLTVVSAPPGFGKTTLLASWAEAAKAAGRAVAWVSLGESERQPESFWTYVVTAIDDAAPGVGTGALTLLRSAQPPIETVVSLVLNELGTRPEGLDLVLDDYHLADGPAIAADVAFLLLHLPAQVQLMIGTRADPALALARLRARGELLEVRAADLRFTLDEAASYLNGVVGLDLQAGDVAALASRTEGWVAALQLAALSLRGRDDVAGFIDGFTGDDRYVVDYLAEEVIGRQPDGIRRFLLETSILERLGGPLCDAVTGGDDGRLVLEQLERSNLFVVPLDDTRTWYRYHHLFADVLRAHLMHERPGQVADLHRRAAHWCAAHGEPVPAVRHAVAAGDVELAADVIERIVIGMLRERQEATVGGWVDLIPRHVVHRRPVLAVGLIGALMSTGRLEGVAERLDDLALVLADPPADTVVLDPTVLPRLPGTLETYRAALALSRGEPAATVAHADRAVALAAPGDDLTVAAASALAGLACWGSGDLVAAHRGYSTAVEGLRRAGHHFDVLGCSITLADLRLTQGRLDDAVRTYEGALRLAAEHEVGGAMRGTADMVLGLSQVALERGDLVAAAAHLSRVELLGEPGGLPQHPYRWRVARARLLEAQGDLTAAASLLEEADRVYVGDFSPNVRPVPAQRARVLVGQGRLVEALEWARAQHLGADDELHYVREYEHVTLARILLRQHAVEGSDAALRAACGLLERLRVAAQEGGRTGTLVEVLTLQALAHHARHGRHDVPGATSLLGQALRLAEPQGYVRLFVAEGPPLVPLLEALLRREPTWAYPRRLLDALAGVSKPVAAEDQGLADPLSARELDVLRLLATDLDGPAIARELVVSLNTVRTHTKSIYAKLGVTSRRAALTRAGELRLLPRR